MQLKSKGLGWRVAGNGQNTANLIVEAVSLTAQGDILASNVDRVTLWSEAQVASLPLTVQVPRSTQRVRVVVEIGGRIGTVDLDRKTIDASPVAPTPPIRRSPNGPSLVVSAPGERITVQELEQVLSAAHGKPDAEIARQLSGIELTERLSRARLAHWEARLPGSESRQALLTLADVSQFLDLPASEVPATRVTRPRCAAPDHCSSSALRGQHDSSAAKFPGNPSYNQLSGRAADGPSIPFTYPCIQSTDLASRCFTETVGR